MAKGPALVIAGKVYSCRAEAERQCSGILNDGYIDSVVTGADSEFVEELWLNRPDKHAQFPGKSIIRYERRYRDGKEKWTRCFWAVFEDGTATDFSFKKALDNIVENQRPVGPV